MKKIYFTLLALLIATTQVATAQSSIGLSFTRTGTDAQSVTVNVTDNEGNAIEGAQATITSSHNFKGTASAVTEGILCPDVNGNTSPQIELTVSVSGVPADFSFNTLGLDIHALNGGSNYQSNSDNKLRQWNVATAVNDTEFGSLDNIDIAAGIGQEGNVHKVWDIAGEAVTAEGGALTLKLTITKGTTNEGCFFGLSAIQLSTASTDPTPDPEPEPEPEPEPAQGFTQTNSELTVEDAAEYPAEVGEAKNAESTGEGCTTGSIKNAIVPVNAPMASDVTVTFQYISGNHKLVILGVDILDNEGNVVKGDYHYGYTGGYTNNNTYTIEGVEAGDYQLRYFFCHKYDDHEVGNQVADITVTGLNKQGAVEPEPKPEPEPDTTGAKIYTIQWKNTGTNYITEGDDQKMYVDGYDVTKRQFWQFIPTGKDNCYYIRNTASGRYIGSCNLTPSSASKIYTTDKPTEYYVAKTSATGGEIAGCWYMSSTDCASYNNENAGPRALNKDGASNDVITWQAGTSRVGSYWKLIESEDLYEVRPFDATETLGAIGTRYNIESLGGKFITLNEDGTVSLTTPDLLEENQEWYFAGANNATGWQIASAMKPATVIGLSEGNIVAQEGNTTRWKVNVSKEQNGYFYFTSGEETLTIDEETLFRFNKLRSQYARNKQIYANPCGTAGNNYLTQLEIKGEEVLDNLLYTATAKPSTWHVLYPHDKATVSKGKPFELAATLKSNAAADLTATVYFDWNCDGIFETSQQITVSGTSCTATVEVPEWAAEKQSRMRVRVNSNGLDLAEDDVQGFIYDIHINVAAAQAERTVELSVNSWKRGRATLSQTAESYAYGTELTATAEAIGTSKFVCWREEGVVVSTDANYTFTVDHNVKLKAYFSPNTDKDSYVGIQAVAQDTEVSVEQIGNSIVAHSTAAVLGIQLYTIDAAKVASNNGSTLNIQQVSQGVYIVQVITDKGYKNVKLFIKK